MLNITDIINKTNVKRLGFWIIRNPKRTFILIFMMSTLFYKWFHTNKVLEKWTGEMITVLSDFKDNGAIELIANKQKILVNLTNYVLPTMPNDFLKDRDLQCEAQLHVYINYLLREILHDAKDLKVRFDKNTKNDIEKNIINAGLTTSILFDGKSLAQELVNKKVLCDLKEIKKTKTNSCEWCTIRNRSGLIINN